MGDAQDKEPLQPNNDVRQINSAVSQDKGRTSGNGSTSSSSGSPDFGYEELSNGLTCPTCQGTGKIPRGQEHDLVALIPYRDERLKPRRTVLYVCLAVFICMAIAGVLCAFLIPRPITFVEDRVETIHANLTDAEDLTMTTDLRKQVLYLSLMNYFNVSNENFLSLQVTNITMQVISTFKGKVINEQRMAVIGLTIPLRTKLQQFTWPVNVTISDDDFPLTYCDASQPAHGIYMIFQTTIYYSFMFQNSQSSLTHYQLVSCVTPTHPVKRSSGILELNGGWEELIR
ncbi:transmembrane protein 106B-like [Amphiura filiformis]|uniref:transmembrane protein 106B-like n=1 Tax=Amphiura filiformis TaxID=82378 RepID=UPI003B217CFB